LCGLNVPPPYSFVDFAWGVLACEEQRAEEKVKIPFEIQAGITSRKQ
jgi:hypothetical protein